MLKASHFLKRFPLVIFITIFLLIIPFFWMKPEEMDLGGDGTRIYFYDPKAYLENVTLYTLSPKGTGDVESHVYYLPFILSLVAVKEFLQSPYILISLMNSLKLAGSFFFVYAIIRDLLVFSNKKKSAIEYASVLGGLFYSLFPILAGNYDRAISTHVQIFVNPLMFFLLLRYFFTHSFHYLWIALGISLLFSVNFSWVATPSIFSFYLLSGVFLYAYSRLIQKQKIPLRGLLFALIIFLGLHAFHILPTTALFILPGGTISSRVFTKGIQHTLDYFFGVVPLSNITINLLAFSPLSFSPYISFVIPLILVVGLFSNKTKNRAVLLTGIFFLISLFFVTAKITSFGIFIYKNLFYIPGFSMFRDFAGKWMFTYAFFYSLLLGQTFFLIIQKCKPKVSLLLTGILIFLILINGWPLLSGSTFNRELFQSNDIKNVITMDKKYEQVIQTIQALTVDGKILTLPFTDYNYQVLRGENDNAYIGASTIPELTGKKDFSGYLTMLPYSDAFYRLVKEQKYDKVKQLLGMLNVRYIFYNQDSFVFGMNFPGYPYQYVREYLPASQKDYEKLISNITQSKPITTGIYALYKVSNPFYVPKISLASNVSSFSDKGSTISASFIFKNTKAANSVVYVTQEECKKILFSEKCNDRFESFTSGLPDVKFARINPTKYRVTLSNVRYPFILSFANSYSSKWQLIDPSVKNNRFMARVDRVLGSAASYLLNSFGVERDTPSTPVASYLDGHVQEVRHSNKFIDQNTFETWGKSSIAEDRHFMVNGYANGWLIKPQDITDKKQLDLILELSDQRTFYKGLGISVLFFIIYLGLSIRYFTKR